MQVSNATEWQTVAILLKQYYDEKLKSRPNKYFSHFELLADDPLAGLTPQHEKFFGPRVCVIFIISKPYGETGSPGLQTISWPPPGFQEAKDKIKAAYPQWTKFEINFYGDGDIINKVSDADPDAADKFTELMESVFMHFEEECTEMAAYGWKWHGRLENVEQASYFYPILDEFYVS